MLRGGGWNNNQRNVRAANRNNNTPDNRNNNVGFRCVAQPGVFLEGQVRRVHGRGASAEREERRLRTCSRLSLLLRFNQR